MIQLMRSDYLRAPALRRYGRDVAIRGDAQLPVFLMNHSVMTPAKGLLPKGPFGVVVPPNEEAIQVKTRFDAKDAWKAAEMAA